MARKPINLTIKKQKDKDPVLSKFLKFLLTLGLMRSKTTTRLGSVTGNSL